PVALPQPHEVAAVRLGVAADAVNHDDGLALTGLDSACPEAAAVVANLTAEQIDPNRAHDAVSFSCLRSGSAVPSCPTRALRLAARSTRTRATITTKSPARPPGADDPLRISVQPPAVQEAKTAVRPPTPPRSPPPGRPAAAVLAGGRMLPPSAAAPQSDMRRG